MIDLKLDLAKMHHLINVYPDFQSTTLAHQLSASS